MPDADARVQSLFVPAHNFMNTSEAKVQNLTFNTEQTQAAVDASKNIVSSFAPIALSADMEKTPSGKAYLSLVKALNARLSPAIHALASIASAREPLAALPAYLQDSWAIASSGVMSRIFPGMNPVTNPSDAEVMRFEVMRRYADFGTDSWHNKLIQDNDESNLWLEYNTTQAVNAYIEYELHQRYEESNALNAAILAQRVNPITEEMVRSAATSVMANKK
jgi:hypothetical protein